jgi:hypothetical protein
VGNENGKSAIEIAISELIDSIPDYFCMSLTLVITIITHTLTDK